MLNLDTIKFTSDTSELDTAAKKIESLGTAISALSVDLAKLDKASTTAAKSQKTITNAAEDAAKANEQQVKSTEAVTEATRKRQSVEERQAAITRIMSEGFSRGQSSILATAEALGEATERTAEYLKTQRAMQGVSPFDKSLGAATVFANELRVMTIANDLYAKGLGFTGTQLQELGREHVRLTEQFKVQGKDLKGLDAEFNNIVTSAKQVTDAENSMALSMKQADKASSDAGKANNFLAREMQRVDAVLTGFNDNLNVTSSNRLMKFREQLRLSGTDAATAATMLKGYEEKLKTINSVSQSKAKNSREEELRYLARATSVQLGDIGISLAGGQNPLLVLIQQGDQLRGVLNQVSANGQEMQKALSMAFGQIVTGSKDVVMALGSFVVGAFVDSGRAIANFGANILGVSGAIERLKAVKFAEWAAEGEAGFSKISRAMRVSELAVSALGVGIGVFVALAAASTVALYQVTNANDKLSTSLIATGAQLGFTTEYAQGLATVLSGMGATRVDVLNTFSEISKSGNITAESFLQVAEAALAIERVGGPAVKETVSLMGQLKEKSVETLTKYAEQTGLVTVAQIAYVAALVEEGKEISATTEATNILTAAIKEQASITYVSLSSMGRLWIDLKTTISDAWGSLQDFTSSSGLLDGMAWAIGRVAANFLEVMFQLARGPRLMADVASTAMALATDAGNLDTNFTAFKNIRAAIGDVDKERQDAHEKQKRRLLQEGEFSSENIKREAEAAAALRKKNSEEASANADLLKVKKLIKDESDKSDNKTLTRQQFINKAIEDKNKLLREGNTLSKEMLATVEKTAAREYDKANKPKKQPKSDAMKGAEDDASWYRKSIERIDDLKNKTLGVVNELSKAQVLLMDLGDDDSFKKLSAQQQIRLVDRINEIDLLEKEIDLKKEQERAEKARLKLELELNKVKDENSKFLNREQASIDKATESSKMKLELLGKTADEQFAITEQYRLQNQLAEIGLRYDERRVKLKSDFDKLKLMPDANVEKLKTEYEQSLAEVNNQQVKAIDSAMQGSANAFEVRYIEKILNIGKTLSDAITTALFEGGQAGTKKLKDYIVGVFREKINVSINAVVNTVLGSVMGGGRSGNSGLQTSGNLSGGSNGNMFSNFGGTVGSGVSNFGEMLINSGSETLGDFGANLISNSTAIGQFADMAGTALSYLSAIDKWSNGQRGAAVGSAIGTYFGGPIGAMIGDAIGGMFDYKLEDKGGGITATLGGSNGLPSGAVGAYRLTEQSGALSGTTMNGEWSTAPQGVADYISKSVQAITAANRAYGESLGLTSDSITNFTRSFDINTTGMDAAAVQTAINAELATFAVEQASATYGAALVGIAREGETTAQTLQRLNTDLTGVNSMFGTLGYTLYDISVAGANAASTLANAFGGLAAAQQQLGSFYENFYSQEEQQSNTYASVQRDLQAVGISYSTDQLRSANRGDIRSAVDSIRGTGNDAQYAAAVKAANILAGIKPATESNPVPVTVEGSSGGGAGDKAADSIANAWQSITDSIWGEVKRIRGLLQESSGDALNLAKQEFEKATIAARGGDQEAAKALPELSKTLLGIAQSQSSTLIELRRAQALTANSLEQTVTQIAGQYGLTVPTFASGGNYEGGVALVGEQGPELINFNQGGYVHNAGQTASMLGGSDELISEIRRLNTKVEQLEAAAISTAISNTKLLKIFQRVTPDGNTIAISGTVTTI